MKLTPKQVRYLYPFLPGIFTRVLRFTGRRNTLHLQETALVMEGELIRFGYIGLERLVPRALAEWTTVTVPYGRIERVKYYRRTVLRILVVLGFVLSVLFLAAGFAMTEKPSWNEALTALPLVVFLGLLAGILLRAFPRCFALVFRRKDGKVSRVTFRIKQRQVREAFAARLAEYRSAARALATNRTEGVT